MTTIQAGPGPASRALRVTLADGALTAITTPAAQFDASGRQRVAQINTLFDGKILGAENEFRWNSIGTGSSTLDFNKVALAVTAGQYRIRQTRHYFPYFSGKPQMVEMTADSFHAQAGVVKRKGYFSSNAVAPYDSNKDGVWLENDGTTMRLIVANNGVEVLNVAQAFWNRDVLAGCDWSKFTVVLFDFLWLGGAVLRLFVKTPAGFTLCHQFDYAGTATDTFMRSPNQPVRYEIRSTTGAGTLRAICSQVGSEGSATDVGCTAALFDTAVRNCNDIALTYALRGVRKRPDFRFSSIRIDTIGIAVTTADSGLLMLCYNPTLSANLTWADNGKVSEGTAAAGQTLTNLGHVMQVIPIVETAIVSTIACNLLSWLTTDITDTPGTYVIAYRPLTTNQQVCGTMNIIEY
jgi:hypothetical protein